MTQPTIGRIVHIYVPPITVPAIVTAVLGSDGAIAATMFPVGGQCVPLTDIEFNDTDNDVPFTWKWPPRS